VEHSDDSVQHVPFCIHGPSDPDLISQSGPVGPDVTVRATLPGDRPGILEVVRQAFGDGSGGGAEEFRIVAAVWDVRARRVLVDMVAVVGGEVVGHVLASVGSLGGQPVPAIAPLAVRPDHQGRGIGSALMHTAMDLPAPCGAPLVVVLGDPTYYGRFGFEAAGPHGIVYRPVGPDSPHFQVCRLGPGGYGWTGEYFSSWEAPTR